MWSWSIWKTWQSCNNRMLQSVALLEVIMSVMVIMNSSPTLTRLARLSAKSFILSDVCISSKSRDSLSCPWLHKIVNKNLKIFIVIIITVLTAMHFIEHFSHKVQPKLYSQSLKQYSFDRFLNLQWLTHLKSFIKRPVTEYQAFVSRLSWHK